VGIFALDALARVPIAVMFGVFLYLGVMNLSGVVMLRRAILIFVPVKYHPTEVYCRQVGANVRAFLCVH
jgi:hypothetical protein